MSSGTPRRIAALYDIHGNLPALEAVLEEIEAAVVYLIVAGGDVVMGPMPRETLARLLDLDIPVQFIQGNCEREMLAELAGAPVGMREAVLPILRWTGEQLSAEERALIAGWPAARRVT